MKHLLALLLAFASLSAHSAQTFSFAGLTWGDSNKVVDQKLRAAGHSGLTPFVRSEPIQPTEVHHQYFTGEIATHPFEADAIFVGNKLFEVLLSFSETRPHQNAEQDVQSLLVTKYGKYRERGKGDRYETFWPGSGDDELTLSFRRRSSLQADNSFTLDYMSREAHRLDVVRRAEGVVQAKKQANEDKAALRAKAAGL